MKGVTLEQPELLGSGFGQALNECYEGSLALWRSQYAKQVRTNDLLGHELRQVEINAQHRRGGRCDVWITVAATISHRSETYYYKLQRVGPSAYVRTAQSHP